MPANAASSSPTPSSSSDSTPTALHLIDEVLTPTRRASGRPTNRPGISPPSFDKQFVRDYLETLDWDKTPPGPICRLDFQEFDVRSNLRAQKALARWGTRSVPVILIGDTRIEGFDRRKLEQALAPH
jgi:glutaredoxin